MVGKTLKELGIEKDVIPPYFSVKEAVFPFNRFPGVDPVLGPEMKSTGEVMGLDKAEIKKIADLAKLELSDSELETYQEQLASVLNYVNKINKGEYKKNRFYKILIVIVK